MKFNLYTVVPLALAAGSMGATTNAPKEAKKSGQSDLKALLADFVSVKGNLLAQADQTGNVEISYFTTGVTKEEQAVAEAAWLQVCTDETDLVYAALKKSDPIHTVKTWFVDDKGVTWFVAFCAAIIIQDETTPEQVLWLSGSVSKRLTLPGHFFKSTIKRNTPRPGVGNKVNK